MKKYIPGVLLAVMLSLPALSIAHQCGFQASFTQQTQEETSMEQQSSDSEVCQEVSIVENQIDENHIIVTVSGDINGLMKKKDGCWIKSISITQDGITIDLEIPQYIERGHKIAVSKNGDAYEFVAKLKKE